MSTTAPANERLNTATRGPLVRRVKIRNYKSIANCDVELGPLTVLVGRNGAGKSNFLDALRFVTDAVQTPLAQAIKSRGGFDQICRKGEVPANDITVELDLDLGGGREAYYQFVIENRLPNGFSVKREILQTKGIETGYYHVEDGKIGQRALGISLPLYQKTMPPVLPDRLYLANAAGLHEFRPVYDALLMMQFYNFSPASMRAVQPPDAGIVLNRDGGNIASVLDRMTSEAPALKEWVKGYLPLIVPGLSDVGSIRFGPVETLRFSQAVFGSNSAAEFYASNVSDGTLRVLGTLVAAAQLAMEPPSVHLVGIEEPETALHPAAAAALMDAMREATVDGQVIVTMHSPDLLDRIDVESDRLLVVQMRDGVTEIGTVDSASQQIIKEHLYSPGELLRMDQLELDWNDLQRQAASRLSVGPVE